MPEVEPGAIPAPEAALPGPPSAGWEPPWTDWTLRPFAATARSPLWVGLGLVAGVAGASQLMGRLFGRSAAWPGAGPVFYADPYFWLDILNAVLLAYIPTALFYLRRGRLHDLRALRPVLACDDRGFALLVEQTLCVAPGRLALCGLIGALLLGAMPLLDPGFWAGRRPGLDEPLLWIIVLRSGMTGWLSGHAVVSEATVTASLARIGSSHLRVDLLALDSLSPFARASQRGAFAWVGVSSLVSLFWLGPAVGVSNAVIVATILLLVSVSFFFSVYGAHRSIAAAKARALDALEARIRPGARELLSGGTGASPDPRLADLVAYHGFVERVREWPLGTPVLLRGALIAAVGIGSWLGSALVERILERALE
jgi:hypothetical protein